MMDYFAFTILIIINFWRKYRFSLNLQSDVGIIRYDGKIVQAVVKNVYRNWNDDEISKIIEDSEADIYIEEMDVSQFSPDSVFSHQLRQRKGKKQDIFKGFAYIEGHQHKVELNRVRSPFVYVTAGGLQKRKFRAATNDKIVRKGCIRGVVIAIFSK